MFLMLLFMFTVVPAVELYFLIQVGSAIGTVNTVFIVLLTGIIGAHFARSQGRSIMLQIQKDLAQGGVPADSAIQGFMVFVGGVLLITPGFVTDFIGLSLVFPLTRKLLLLFFKRHFKNAVRSGKYKVYSSQNFGQGPMGGGGFRVYTHTSQGWSDMSETNNVRDVIEVSAEAIEGKKDS